MKKRKLLIILLSSGAFLILFIALTPTLLSTQSGKNMLTGMVSKDLKIETLTLNWLGPQDIKKITYPGFKCDEIKTENSLWALLWERDLGNLQIIKPQVSINENQPFTITSKKNHSSSSSKSSKDEQLPFTGHVIVEEGEVEIQNSNLDQVHFEHINLDLNFPKETNSLAFKASGETSQDNLAGQFAIQGEFQPIQEEVVFEGTLTHFPLKGIDQIISVAYPNLKGILIDALGPSFDAVIDAKVLKEGPTFNVTASSSHFNANIQTIAEAGNLVLKSPAVVTLSLVPDLIKRVMGFTPQVVGQIQLKINELKIPLNDPSKGLIVGKLDLLNTTLSSALALNQFSTDFTTSNLSQGIQFTSTGSLQLKEELANLLGPTASVNSSGIWGFGDSKGNINLNFKSDRLQINQMDFSQRGKHLSLISPAMITYLPSQSSSQILTTIESAELTLDAIENMTLKAHARTSQFLQLKDLDLLIGVDGWKKIELRLKEKQFLAEAVGSYAENSFTLTQPATLSGILSNELFSDKEELPLLIKPSPFQVRLQPFSILLTQDLIPQIKVKADGTVDDLYLSTKDERKEIALGQLQMKLQIDASKELALFEMTSKGLDLHLSIDHLIFGKTIDTSLSTLGLNLDLQNFSSAVVESFAGESCPLNALLGPTIDLNLKALTSPQSQNLSVSASSKFLTAQISLAVKEGMLGLQNNAQPGKFDFTLTKEGFSALSKIFDQKDHFELIKQGEINGIVSEFQWPITFKENPTSLLDRLPELQGKFADIRMQGQTTINSLSLLEKNTGNIANLNKLKLVFDKPAVQEPIHLHLDGFVSSKNYRVSTPSKEGKIAIDSKLNNLFTATGEIDRDNMKTEIQASLENFPTLLLDFFKEDAKLSKLFGSSLFLTLKANIQKLNGPINLTIQAPSTRASLNGQLQNGVLTLSEPIYAQVNITPDVSSYILQSANPLSLSKISADNPLTLQIDPTDFALPLFPFNLSQFNIGKARIELGKIRCKNEGSLNFTVGLLKSNQLMSQNELLLWFAPMDLQFNFGVLNIERTEIFIGETFDIAFWGKIDIPKDNVDMVLGLTADALKQAFSIKDLPPNYVLQIPLKGKTTNVEINKSSATAKIALLLVWQQKALAGSLAGGPAGGMLGSLLNKVGPLPDFDKKAPPAKRPFPWETYEEPKAQKKKASNKAKHNFKDKPLKQVLKLLR